MIESIFYKQLVSVDMWPFKAEECIEYLCNQLVLLKFHSFIAHQQSEYLTPEIQYSGESDLHKVGLFQKLLFRPPRKSLEVPLKQWTGNHSFKKIKFKSLFIVSKCLTHNTIAVHTFQRKPILFLKENVIVSLEIVLNVSDGSGAPYKNWNISQTCVTIKRIFFLYAEWHFYATAHGKRQWWFRRGS